LRVPAARPEDRHSSGRAGGAVARRSPEAARGPHIKRRVQYLIPPGREIVAILGAVVFAVHSWSVRGFLYNLPSFLLKYRMGEILAVFCYHMAFAFVESLCIMAALLGASVLLPGPMLRKGFAYKGLLILAAGCAAAVFMQESYVSESFAFVGPARGLFWAQVAAGSVGFLGLYVASFRALRVQRVLTWLADQLSVMLLVYLPLDLVGLLVVGFRLLR
jgi:hypothetical protein